MTLLNVRSSFLRLLCCALLQMAGASFVWAQVPRAASYDPVLQSNPSFLNYVKNRSLQSMAQIPPELRAHAIADLMAAADGPENGSDFEVPERRAILARYFDDAPVEFKNQVLALAFQMAANFNRFETAYDIFDQHIKDNSALATQAVCGAMATFAKDPAHPDDAISEQALKSAALTVRSFLPLIAQTPNLANQLCIIQSASGQTKAMTISELVSLTNPEFQLQLKPSLRLTYETAQVLSRAYSSCSLKQIEDVMWRVAFQQMKPRRTRVGYVDFNYQGCVIRGVIQKISEPHADNVRFEFLPESLPGERKLDPIPFQTYQQIAAILKTQPQAYVIKSNSTSH
jgi:hypothetical protein